MKVVCSQCRQLLGEKEPLGDPSPTHSLCPPCRLRFTRRLAGTSLGDALEQVDCPVLMLDGDGRVIAANSTMAQRLGREQEETLGLLGGEVVGCVHSLEEPGCGKNPDCSGCQLRQAVEETARTGKSQRGLSVRLRRRKSFLELKLSTETLEQGGVQLTLESMELQ